MKAITWVGIAVPLVLAIGAAAALSLKSTSAKSTTTSTDSSNRSKIETAVQNSGNVQNTFNTFGMTSPPTSPSGGAGEEPPATTAPAPVTEPSPAAVPGPAPTPPSTEPIAPAPAPVSTEAKPIEVTPLVSYAEKCSGLKKWLKIDRAVARIMKDKSYRISLTLSNAGGISHSISTRSYYYITITDSSGNYLSAKTDLPYVEFNSGLSIDAYNSGIAIPVDETRTINFTTFEVAEPGLTLTLEASVVVAKKIVGDGSIKLATDRYTADTSILRCEDIPLQR